MRQAHATICPALLLLLGGALAAGASELQPQGWHVVRPGDTLLDLTRTYTGSTDPWRDNWGLNTFVQDPDLLQPGWRLRLLLQPAHSRPAAQLVQLARRVESKPAPQPWGPAQVGDLLLDRDAVRTFDGASTELAFTDGGHLRLTERSLVFLVRPTQSVASARRGVEIVEGEADLQLGDAGAARREVEVVAGSARAALRTAPGSEASSRTRRAVAGGSQWMIYQGDATLAAGGKRVELAAGTGSTVAAKSPPTPPEALLPAPALRPTHGSATVAAHLELAWEAVPGAARYIAELCPDSACGVVLQRVTALAEPLWRPEPIEPGDYYWRASAVAPSGLDGFAAPAQALSALDHEPDTLAPEARLGVGGPHVEIDGEPVFSGEAIVQLTASDEGSGVARRTLLVDGTAAEESRLRGPWASGEHRVEARVADRAGNEAVVGPLIFTVDADAPQIELEPATAGSDSNGVWRMLSELSWTADQGWSAWRWISGERRLHRDLVRGTWSLGGGEPTLSLAWRGTPHISGDGTQAIPGGPSLAFTARDAGSGVATFRLRPKQRREGDRQILVLRFDSADRLGNRRVLTLEVRPD